MKNLICLLVLFISLTTQAQETYTITGTVTDEKGIALPGATVFIANTQKATSTNSEGKFILNGLEPGNYDVSANMIGFMLFSQPVVIKKSSVNVPIVLKDNSIMLKAVTISGMSNETRKLLMMDFLQNLLGQSPNAKACKLLNPDAVNLNYDKKEGRLEANSDEFLIIENRSLGYNIHYLLSRFKKTIFRNMVSYDGTLFFEEMKGTPSEQKKWEKNRELAYRGSITHFFRSLYTNTLNEQGFIVYRFLDDAGIDEHNNKFMPVNSEYFSPYTIPVDWLTDYDENNKLFDIGRLRKDSTELYVIYSGAKTPANYVSTIEYLPPFTKKPNGQLSILHPQRDSLLVNRNGNINPPNNLLRVGYWTWVRMADFLPSDYVSPADIKKQ